MALQGFDKEYYLGQKLAALQATESEWVGKTTDFLETVLGNVYGLTAEEHYMQYGWQEGLAPNQYFNAEEYKLAKAQQLFDSGNYLTVESAMAAFEDAWQQDPYQHYIQYGAGESINPSNDFDASQYFADKLAALQAADPDTYGDWTATDVQTAFLDAGLTAIEHFMLYGKDEGLTVTAVPAGEQVNPGESTPTVGETFTLTTSVDEGADFTGGAGNDTFVGSIDNDGTTDNSTFTTLDSLDGGDGTDTLKLSVLDDNAAGFPTVDVTNVENLNLRAAVAVNEDFSTGYTGLTAINVTQAGAALTVEAATTTDITSSGTKDSITLDGGKDISVTDATADKAITIGNTTVNAGTVTVTDTDQGNATIAVDGGTDVTIAGTADQDTTGNTAGDITVGQGGAATDLPSGAVSVTQNLDSDGTADLNSGNITVDGGSTIDVTVNATNAAKAEDSDQDIFIHSIDVGAGKTTTDISVTQNESITAETVAASGGVTESASVKFGALKDGDALKIAGLTFTASADLTAAEVAEAFANLTKTDYQTAGGEVANGVFTGQVNGGWTSGAANGDTVVFTSTTKSTDVTNLNAEADYDATGVTGGTAPTVTTTAGKANTTAADSSQNEVFNGQVAVNDNATASVETVTLDGYGYTSTVGVATSMDALTTLNLKNSGVGTEAITDVAAATTTGGDATTNEVQTLDFTNWVATGAGNFDIAVGATTNTVTVAAGDDGATIAGKVAAALNNTNVDGDAGSITDAAVASGSTVTITYGNTGDIVQAVTALTGAGDAVFTNATSESADVRLQTAQTALTLNVDNVNGDVDLDNTASAQNITDLTLNATDEESTFALTAAAVTNLSIDAAVDLDISTSTHSTNLETVAIAGAGEVDLGDVSTSAGINSFDASANTGGVVATIETASGTLTGDIEEYLFGGGDDVVTLGSAAVDVDVTLGAGDDTLKLATDSTTVPTGAVTGGDGTDTLSMTINSAAAFDDNTNLAAAATGFERLTISDAAGAVTLNMSNLGYDYVTTSGTSGGAFVLDNFANEGTVVLTAAQTGTTEVAIDSADTNAADVLNVMTKVSTADIVAGELIAADVETINITATDSNVDEDKDGTSYETGDRDLSTLKLTADTAETVKVTGNANLDLDLNTSTKVTKVDASTLEGDLTLIADGAVAGTEVIGGTGDDVLTASGENDVLKGGAGDDIFNAGDLTQIYGGDGADTFNFDVISSYTKVSTVHDAETGDVFNLVDDGTAANVVTSGGVAVDKFYAAGAQYNENTTTDVIGKINASLVQTGEGEATWFNHGDNTYIVIDADDGNDLAAGAQDTYQQGEDTVIEIVGVFDLSTEASFNASNGTLEMA